MKEVKVLIKFRDKHTKDVYEKGTTINVAEVRLDEIIENLGEDFVEVVGETNDTIENPNTEFPEHTGGGFYILSNGEKVRGKQAAIEAEDALQAK